jgi:hypothetical protein
MGAGIAAFGDLGLSGTFGWESNELHRKVYLQDPAGQLFALLQELFGESPNPQISPFPAPFNSFYACSVNFDTGDKTVQGDTFTPGDFSILQSLPAAFRSGMSLDVTYRPMDNSGYQPVTGEGWDFSAQTMSLIGNNFGQNPNNLAWGSDSTPITNLSAIIKIVPKIEVVQTRVWCTNLPAAPQYSLMGGVNAGPLQFGASGQGNYNSWAPETCLLVGLPSVRRWRFDGTPIFEIGVKIAINIYQDVLAGAGTGGAGGTKDYVTWNRLYRSDKGFWDRVQVGPNKVPIYPGVDLTQATGSL